MAQKEKQKIDERLIKEALRKHSELSKSEELSTHFKDHIFRNQQGQPKKRGKN